MHYNVHLYPAAKETRVTFLCSVPCMLCNCPWKTTRTAKLAMARPHERKCHIKKKINNNKIIIQKTIKPHFTKRDHLSNSSPTKKYFIHKKIDQGLLLSRPCF